MVEPIVESTFGPRVGHESVVTQDDDLRLGVDAPHTGCTTRGSRSRGSHRHELGCLLSCYAHSDGAEAPIRWFSEPGGNRNVA
jgi:hypothetical protein